MPASVLIAIFFVPRQTLHLLEESLDAPTHVSTRGNPVRLDQAVTGPALQRPKVHPEPARSFAGGHQLVRHGVMIHHDHTSFAASVALCRVSLRSGVVARGWLDEGRPGRG